MRDVQPSINSAFQDTKDPGTSSGTCQANVQEASECTWGTIYTLYIVFITSDLFVSCVDLMQLKFCEQLQNKKIVLSFLLTGH